MAARASDTVGLSPVHDLTDVAFFEGLVLHVYVVIGLLHYFEAATINEALAGGVLLDRLLERFEGRLVIRWRLPWRNKGVYTRLKTILQVEVSGCPCEDRTRGA